MSQAVAIDASNAASRLRSIDTLRGVAIVLIVAFHASRVFPWQPWQSSLFNLGNLGVQLFFLVSGVTMCLMWERRHAEPSRTLKFYVRRVMRIAPPYWIALVFYQGLHVWRGEPMSTAYQITLNALFLHALSPTAINSAVPGGWSIGVEMAFYAVFPLLTSQLVKPLHLMAIALVVYILLGVGAVSAVLHYTDTPPLALYYSPLTQFPVFCIGMCIYAISMGRLDAVRERLLGVAVAWIAAAFAIKYGLHLEARPFFWLPVFGLAALCFGCIVRRWSNGLLATLGTLSYSLYLAHFAVIAALEACLPIAWRAHKLGYPLFLVAALGGSALVAWVARVTIEAGSIHMGALIVDRLARRERRSSGDSAMSGEMRTAAK